MDLYDTYSTMDKNIIKDTSLYCAVHLLLESSWKTISSSGRRTSHPVVQATDSPKQTLQEKGAGAAEDREIHEEPDQQKEERVVQKI